MFFFFLFVFFYFLKQAGHEKRGKGLTSLPYTGSECLIFKTGKPLLIMPFGTWHMVKWSKRIRNDAQI